jgi:hypothetical protein
MTSKIIQASRAVFVYQAARQAAIAAEAPVIPPAWAARDTRFQDQFIAAVDKQCGSERATSPAVLHENWMESYLEMGWVYGPDYNAERKTHPDLVPYGELGQLERDKDDVFLVLCALAWQYIRDPDETQPVPQFSLVFTEAPTSPLDEPDEPELVPTVSRPKSRSPRKEDSRDRSPREVITACLNNTKIEHLVTSDSVKALTDELCLTLINSGYPTEIVNPLPSEKSFEDDIRAAQAEEPVDNRILRAFLTGYREGAERAHQAARGYRFDHS